MANTDSNPNPGSFPSDEQLASYALGELVPPQSSDIERAIGSSDSLRRRLASIQSTLGSLQSCDLHEPPRHLVQQALRLMQQVERPNEVGWLARAVDAVATLIFDSFTRPAAMGLRSAGLADVRHLTFDSDSCEVDVEILQIGNGRVRFVGQITADGADDQAVRVGYIGGRMRGEANTDKSGRFSFEVPRGEWEIKVQIGERVISLPGIVT